MKSDTKTHKRIQTLLSHYRDWDEGERALVEAHLAECQSCADQLAHYQMMDNQIRQLPMAKPAPVVRQSFYEAVHPAQKRWFQRVATTFTALNQVGAVALLVLVVAGIFLTVRNISQPTIPLAPPNDAPTHLLDQVAYFPVAQIQAITLNQNGQLLAIATDVDIQIWNLTSQILLHQFPMPFPAEISHLTFTNTLLVAFFNNSMIQSWHLGTGEANSSFEIDASNFNLFSQSESLLWVLEKSEELIIQPINDDTISIITTDVKNPPIQAVDVSTYRWTDVVFADAKGVVYLFDYSGELIWKMPAQSLVTQLSLSQNSNALASLNNKHEVEIWSVTEGAILQTISLGIAPQEIRLLPAGEGVFILYPDGSITIWDTETGEPVVNFAGISNREAPMLMTNKTTFAFTSNGFVVITLSETGVTVWEKPDGQ